MWLPRKVDGLVREQAIAAILEVFQNTYRYQKVTQEQVQERFSQFLRTAVVVLYVRGSDDERIRKAANQMWSMSPEGNE